MRESERGGVRTSRSHPMRVDSVEAGARGGRIGISFCPGKCGAGLSSVLWQRDVDIDLDVVAAWAHASC